jgi:hypothetical protein
MASTYLTSNTGTATNAKKFTLSMWIKRSSLCDTNSQRFYQGYQDGNNRFYAMFDNTNSYPDSLWVYAVTGGSTQVYWYSARKFRDLNAWYHIVFSADSTQASQADRLKVYVNGVEETSWTKTNNPSQNIDWGNQLAQSNNDLTISGTESQTQLFDGSMSHIHFIDGTAYDATAFGSTDATTGEWKINTSPSVTYGNNGYFILKDGNSVTDQSPNSNNFTVGGGTLTKTEDNPSNVFATLNTLTYSASALTINKGNNSKAGSSSNSWRSIVSNLGASTGKYYFEIKVHQIESSDPNNFAVGITDYEQSDDQTSTNGKFFAFSRGYGYYAGNGKKVNNNSAVANGVAYGNSWTTNDIIGCAFDLDNGKIYWSKNGTWQNSGVPTSGSTGTGSAFNITTGYTYFPVMAQYYSAEQYSFNFGNGYFGTTAVASAGTNASGNGIFEYDVPTGYTALSTKGLNL